MNAVGVAQPWMVVGGTFNNTPESLLYDQMRVYDFVDPFDNPALRQAIGAADFASVRGPFKFGVNHYPVQDFWLLKVARRPDGKFQTETVRKVLEANVDPWAGECRMRR